MYFKRKYFIFFIVLLVALMGIVSAADTDDSIETVTSDISTGGMAADTPESIEVKNINFEDTVNPEDYNVAPSNENNNIKSRNNSLNNKESNDNFETDTNLLQKKSTDKVKTQSNDNVTTITEDNYNNYLSISSGKARLNQNYFVPGNNYTIHFQYFPSNTTLALNNFYNNKYRNDTIKIAGTINDTTLQVNKGSLKSLCLEDMVLNYHNNYMGDYLNISSMVGINNVTINANVSGNKSCILLNCVGENTTIKGCTINANITCNQTSSPLYVGGRNSVVENCTINANIPSSQVDWSGNSLPKGIGVWITGFYSTLRNNRFNITESCILSDGTHRSLYGVYVRANNLDIYNNTVIVTGTQYTYGFVVRASQNSIYNNNITVRSVYYSAGVNIEGNGMKNNYIYDNRINVSAGFEQTDQGNPDVAYGCLILDFSYGGGEYVASISSMENNRYINNTVIADARQSYAFELYGGVNTQIIGNNMTLTGNYPMGIGAIGINTTMDNNAIYVDGNSNGSEYSVDYIKPTTVGIYTYWMNEGNIITNNTIAVTNGKALKLDNSKNVLVENNFLLTEDYAYVIEVDNINNTFKYNAILGEGTIEEVIKDTTDNENIYINNREPTASQLSIDAKDFVELNETVDIIISLEDENGYSIPDQYVQVQIGENNIQTLITDNDGKIELTFTPTTKETTTVTATYECYKGCGSNTTKDITVGKKDTNITINIINQTKYNENITITGTLKDTDNQPITDDIQITFNNEEITLTTDSEGTYSFTTIAKNIGTNNITASYNGNTKYNPTSTTTTFTVIGKLPVVVTYEPISDVNFGENVTISGKFMTSNGKAISNSNVKIYINGVKYLAKTDNTGTYLLSVQTTQTGINKVNIGYSGNDKYEAYETNTTFQVLGKQPIIVTYEQITDVNFGENVTITGKFTTNTGKAITNSNVKIYINGVKYLAKTDNTGTYTLSVQTTQIGINKVSIGYSGNDKYEAYETNTTFTVLGKQPVIVTYEPISDVNFGENVTITGKFMTSNGKAISNSNVKIYINGVKYLAKTDKTGTYVLSVETTQTGVNKVSIGYSGNDKYEAYETNTTFQVLGKQPVIVTYEPISDVNFGENVTITGKFMTSNGKVISNSNVKIYINGVKYLAKTDNTGTYVLSVQTTQTGTNKVSIGYSGNDKYEAYETNTTFTVLGKQPVIVTYEPINNVKQGQNVTITGKFTTNTGKAITNTNVKILINGKKYYAKTDNTGKYTLSTQANTLGTNNVTIGYSGNDKYEAYETNTTFTVTA